SDPNASLQDYYAMSAILERNLTRLERSVADLLWLAQAEKDMVREEVMLRPLLEDLLRLLTPFAQKHDVALQLTGATDIRVNGDESLLARVFGNLLENAIFYNKPNGYVTVTLRSESPWAVITVTDTGVGIRAEEQPHIFEPFYRARDSGTQHREGVGLGLALVAHMVKLHGGRVQVNSTPNGGSQFTVRLPLY